MKNQPIHHIFFIYSIILKYISCKMDTTKVIATINCGGDEYNDSNSIKYDADNYFNGGTSSENVLNFNIKNTDNEMLYQT